MEKTNLSGLKREDFQATVQGKQTDLFTLTNASGAQVQITNYGGAVAAIMVPDKDGNYANVVQGYNDIQGYLNAPEPFLSTLIGRFGNRICKGKFLLDGVEYDLAINNGPNALHGGPTGIHARVWDALQIDEQTLQLEYTCKDMEEGFPGDLAITVIYQWTDDNELVIEYSANTNKTTIVNLTNHGFFSLAGIANPTPTIDDLECEINADHYLPIDETSIPLGCIAPVEGTPFDFREPKPVGRDIDADDVQIKNGAGYDHCFVLNKDEVGELSFAARIYEPHSGRSMEVYTTEPGVQVYTDNWATGYPIQQGATAPRRSAICFEAQHFPDSPNRGYFPSTVLHPGETYSQVTIYAFGVEK